MTSAEPADLGPTRLRRARIAVSLLFFTNGAIPGNLIPRLPAVKSELGLSNAAYGVAIAAGPIGALVSALLAGVLIRRFRSSRVAVIGMIASAAFVVLAGAAPVWGVLAAAMFAAGALDAVVDVGQNSHGLRVQRLYGRSILNSFHAVWSVGALTGGLMGGAAAALDLPLTLHLALSGVLLAGVNVLCYRFLLPGAEPASPRADPAEPGAKRRSAVRPAIWGALLALGVIAIAASIVEDAGNTWAALYLSDSLGAVPAVAAFGFVSLAGAQFVGRLIGDRMVDRFGQRTMARAGGLVTGVGMGVALAFPSVPGSVVGFGLAGFGIATLIPAAIHTADELPGFRPGTAIGLLNWMMRLGFLLSPPLVGVMADATSLRWGLLIVPVSGLLVVLLAGVLPRRPRPTERIVGSG